MARYFFNLYECGTVVPDQEGMELADLDAARRQAVEEARGVIAAEVKDGKLCLGCRIDVVDEARNLVVSVRFRDAVTVIGL